MDINLQHPIYVWKVGEERQYSIYHFSTLGVLNSFTAILDKDPLMYWDIKPPVTGV